MRAAVRRRARAGAPGSLASLPLSRHSASAKCGGSARHVDRQISRLAFARDGRLPRKAARASAWRSPWARRRQLAGRGSARARARSTADSSRSRRRSPARAAVRLRRWPRPTTPRGRAGPSAPALALFAFVVVGGFVAGARRRSADERRDADRARASPSCSRRSRSPGSRSPFAPGLPRRPRRTLSLALVAAGVAPTASTRACASLRDGRRAKARPRRRRLAADREARARGRRGRRADLRASCSSAGR